MQQKPGLLGLVVCFVSSAAFSGITHAAAPPLQPNEEIVKTKDGCGMVLDKTAAGAPYMRQAFANLTWGGACIDGLATGEGIVSAGVKLPNQPAMLSMTGWVWYGRLFGPTESRWENGQVQKNFSWEHKTVFYKSLDVSAPPVWSQIHSEGFMVGDGDTVVTTLMAVGPQVMVYRDQKSQLHPCPDSSSTKICGALWAQHAGPVIQRIKAFLAENEPKAKARMAEIQPLVAAWKAKVGPAVVAKREADAKRAAGEQFDSASKKAVADQACLDKFNQAPFGFSAPTSETNIKRAQYLRNLFKGECAGHPHAAKGLKEADDLLAKVPELQKQEALTAKYEKEEKEQREKDRKETSELLGKVAGAVLSGKSSAERKQNAINALGGGGAGSGDTQVWKLELNAPGIVNKTHCVKLHPATLPISRKWVVGGLPANFYEPRNDPQYRLEPQYRVDDRDVPGSRRAVLLENTCAETVNVYYAACFEQRTNVASSNTRKVSWPAGMVVDMEISSSPGITYPVWKLQKGQYAYLGQTYTEKSRIWDGGDSTVHKVLAQIAYGAWQGDFLIGPTTDDVSAAGAKLRKKHIAMRTIMTKTYFNDRHPHWGSHSRGGSAYNPNKDLRPCSALNLQEAWNAER